MKINFAPGPNVGGGRRRGFKVPLRSGRREVHHPPGRGCCTDVGTDVPPNFKYGTLTPTLKTPFRDTIGAPVEPFYALLGAFRYTISVPVEPFYALLGAFRYTISHRCTC